MELVRKLLVLLEEQENDHLEVTLPDDLDREVAVHHLVLMEQAGFVKNNIKYADNMPFWIYSSLTWNGHEFLDAIRNDGVWNKVKDGIKSKGFEVGTIPFEVVKEFAKLQLRNILGLS